MDELNLVKIKSVLGSESRNTFAAFFSVFFSRFKANQYPASKISEISVSVSNTFDYFNFIDRTF